MAFSTAARTSFAIWPMMGRSSAERLPICLSTAVNSPFLPRYLTRSASSSAAAFVPTMESSAPLRMASSCSFIIKAKLLFVGIGMFGSGRGAKQKALRPTLGRKAHFRGTTQICAKAHTCALITEGDRHVSMEAPGRTKPSVRRSACSR